MSFLFFQLIDWLTDFSGSVCESYVKKKNLEPPQDKNYTTIPDLKIPVFHEKEEKIKQLTNWEH